MKPFFTYAACLFTLGTIQGSVLCAQELLETGGKKMPDQWIDKDTHHKVVRLSRKDGNNQSFYFHNNPFVASRMVYYSNDASGRQIYTVDLKTLQTNQVTSQHSPMNGEIVAPKSRRVFYQIKDSVFATGIDTHKTELVYVFPADYKASITTINADETLLAGSKASDEQKEIARKYPEKKDFFDRIFDAHLANDLFTVDLKTKRLKKVHTENTWLGHIQFSPTDPNLLMFCHEGPWHKVDRIWTIDLKSGAVKLMHKRTMEMEIAGHEWFSPDGRTIYYDLQQPRSTTFYVGATDVTTGAERKYQMDRDDWSIHFNVSPDQKLFCGDGGDPGQVAKARDGMWINLFTPVGERFKAERLVNMKHHNYKLEPNVHFSPDGKWVIFRANFEGQEEVYAVDINRAK
jgi:oligogalacturonide lyase